MSDFTDRDAGVREADPGGREPELVDLAARRLGGMVIAANDEFFAPKEKLLAPQPPAFDPNRYTDRGKEMDGWETRRRRDPGHDWCVVRLGVPGIVRGVVVDTTHFRGNFPESSALDGCVWDGDASSAGGDQEWVELLPRTALQGDARNRFSVTTPFAVTHLRLRIYPDGGVARLRVHGEPVVDLRGLADAAGRLDVAALVHGGTTRGCSDRFFSSPDNLLMVGDAQDMGDGWETRRRRGPGHDWVVVALAAAAQIDRVEVDTTHFKGNYPESCSLDACASVRRDPDTDAAWREVVSPQRLGPHARHAFSVDEERPATHVRLNIYPDGGVARLRVYGRVTDDGWRQAGLRWLNALLPSACAAQLAGCCGSRAWARAVTAGRPFADFAALRRTADAVWSDLDPGDWLEAFAAHPRVGERPAPTAPAALHREWSRQEQEGAAGASAQTLAALAEGNRAYEERFGHVFLICATGMSAEGMLAALRKRLDHDPDTELRAAAEEQRKITHLRLEKLMRPAATS